MFRSSWLFILSLIVIYIGIILSPTGLAAGETRDQADTNDIQQQDPVMIANQFLDRLQAGYETGDIPLIVSLYNDPLAAVDVTRDENKFYTASSFQTELTQALTGLTAKKCSFSERQITAADDMIMIRTMRSVTANEVPITANCLMVMILRKTFIHKDSWDYIVTDQILLKEEYIPKSDVSGQQNNTGQ
jgi:hypothetical protein